MFISGSNIVNQDILSKPNLLYLIKENKVTAHDANTFDPIDWQRLETEFKTIQKLAQLPGKRKQPEPEIIVTADLGRHTPDLTGDRDYQHQESQQERLIVYHDTYKDGNGIERNISRVEWKELLINLSNEWNQTIISQSQWRDILGGWGAKIMEPYALEAVFEQSETEKTHP